jgi:hypothetical protein
MSLAFEVGEHGEQVGLDAAVLLVDELRGGRERFHDVAKLFEHLDALAGVVFSVLIIAQLPILRRGGRSEGYAQQAFCDVIQLVVGAKLGQAVDDGNGAWFGWASNFCPTSAGFPPQIARAGSVQVLDQPQPAQRRLSRGRLCVLSRWELPRHPHGPRRAVRPSLRLPETGQGNRCHQDSREACGF